MSFIGHFTYIKYETWQRDLVHAYTYIGRCSISICWVFSQLVSEIGGCTAVAVNLCEIWWQGLEASDNPNLFHVLSFDLCCCCHLSCCNGISSNERQMKVKSTEYKTAYNEAFNSVIFVLQ